MLLATGLLLLFTAVPNGCSSDAASAATDALAAKFDDHQFIFTAQKRELERRNSINSDPRRSMEARYKGREQWFRAHPNDFPARPN